MRLAYYAGASTAAAAACLVKAFHERPNFYSATVYLSQSNACLLIITNLLLFLSCSFMYGLQRLLYGPLRPIEVEQLSEKAWYAVLDTLLAMPSFRENVGGWLLAMFTLLLAGKVWGWIGEGKVDVLEQQPPANPILFHARLATSLVVSVIFDLWMLDYCVETVLAKPQPGMMVIFAFEFAVLSICSAFTLSRYLLCVVQIRIEKDQTKKAIEERKSEILAERAEERQRLTNEGVAIPESLADEAVEVDENEIDIPGWEDKRRYLFALEVFTDFIKLVIYIVFFTVSITFNGLPMHIMRDVYMTFASFSKRITNFMAYRKATSDMNTRYPDATTEEIRGDACIVCRESMVAWEAAPNSDQPAQPHPAAEQPPQAAPPHIRDRKKDEGLRAKKLPCGHILHLRCLKAWLERQQVCPTCRSPVVAARPGAMAAQAQGGAAAAAAGGVPAPNHPGAGQQQHPPAANQPAQRQPNRARILNLGPVRIGFLNGPGDQIANLLRQMNNQPAAPAARPAQQDPTQQGPNHLGLQEPYLPGSSDSGASTLAQLQQLEQRITREAHSLTIQAQRLTTLTMMERELARLRALQAANSLNGNAMPSMEPPSSQVARPFPMTPRMPFQPHHAQVDFHGNPSQQYSNGHETLPPGMTLPEGWTVMPLRRSDTPSASHSAAQSTATQPTTAPTTAAPASTEVGDGPTDDNGSPLFVPTAPEIRAPTATTTVHIPSLPTAESSANPIVTAESAATPAAPSPSSAEATQASQSDGGRRVPWTTSDGWNFVEPPNGQSTGSPSNEASTTVVQPACAPIPESSDGTSEGKDKGKGKAAAVEEVPDSGM